MNTKYNIFYKLKNNIFNSRIIEISKNNIVKRIPNTNYYKDNKNKICFVSKKELIKYYQKRIENTNGSNIKNIIINPMNVFFFNIIDNLKTAFISLFLGILGLIFIPFFPFYKFYQYIISKHIIDLLNNEK